LRDVKLWVVVVVLEEDDESQPGGWFEVGAEHPVVVLSHVEPRRDVKERIVVDDKPAGLVDGLHEVLHSTLVPSHQPGTDDCEYRGHITRAT